MSAPLNCTLCAKVAEYFPSAVRESPYVIVGFSPTLEIDSGGAQYIGGGSPHPSG